MIILHNARTVRICGTKPIHRGGDTTVGSFVEQLHRLDLVLFNTAATAVGQTKLGGGNKIPSVRPAHEAIERQMIVLRGAATGLVHQTHLPHSRGNPPVGQFFVPGKGLRIIGQPDRARVRACPCVAFEGLCQIFARNCRRRLGQLIRLGLVCRYTRSHAVAPGEIVVSPDRSRAGGFAEPHHCGRGVCRTHFSRAEKHSHFHHRIGVAVFGGFVIPLQCLHQINRRMIAIFEHRTDGIRAARIPRVAGAGEPFDRLWAIAVNFHTIVVETGDLQHGLDIPGIGGLSAPAKGSAPGRGRTAPGLRKAGQVVHCNRIAGVGSLLIPILRPIVIRLDSLAGGVERTQVVHRQCIARVRRLTIQVSRLLRSHKAGEIVHCHRVARIGTALIPAFGGSLVLVDDQAIGKKKADAGHRHRIPRPGCRHNLIEGSSAIRV
jgi:hypothetical protein